MQTKRFKQLAIGTLAGVLICGITVMAFDDPIARLAKEYNTQWKIVQSVQFQKKQAEARERLELTKLCEILKEKASVMKIEGTKEYSSEKLKELDLKTKLNCSTWSINSLKDIYTSPNDLYYVFLKNDGVYTSQTMRQHFYRNGYAALDIGTNNKKLNIYAPSYLKSKGEDLEREYTVHLANYPKTTGRTMILSWQEDGVEMSFLLGHISEYLKEEGDTVKTGDIIAISGGNPKEADQGVTTGLHLHFEARMNDIAYPYPAYLYAKHTTEDGTIDIEEVDLDKLAYAVAMAETGNCTKGAGSVNNCQGIMEWSTGIRKLKVYKSKEDSYADFKKIWSKSYKTFPDLEMAKIWTGGDSPQTWLANLTYYYAKS